MKHWSRLLVCAVFLGALAARAVAAEPLDSASLPPAAAGPMDFERDIQPILARTCLTCHGPAKRRGGLRLDDGAEASKGGNSGTVIQPGDSAHSRLVHIVAGLDPDTKMPPAGKTPLTAVDVGKLRAWIDQGAHWPRTTTPKAPAAEPSNHWAYRPLKRPPVPTVQQADWLRNDLDAFILARLEREGLTPAPEANRTTLIRRLFLDLLGLPPTPRDVAQFVADARPDAYELLVERLLASSHYGERWGRHWLDAARYADTDGYGDRGRPFAWRWREWVIEALNRDMPFDQFTIEQLAGDLLPNATVEQKSATGFHRHTLTNREGCADREEFRVQAVVDRVNTTARVFLGTTIGCAQCHDHKYDPFSQREFYQLFAFFNCDQEADLAAPLPGEEIVVRQRQEVHDRKTAELQTALNDYRQQDLVETQRKWEESLKLEDLGALSPAITAILLLPPAERTEKQQQELSNHFAGIDKKFVELMKAITDHQRAAPQVSKVMTLAVGAARTTHVLIRGDFLRRGVEVQPGVPGILNPLLATSSAPTRLDLAQWLVDPANPLTARVLSNWVWHKYFGRGLVSTLEDFGVQGEKPSHPELLDYLATEFIRRQWSLKYLHRLIVTSATYRQSSWARPELLSRDPLNVLLARQNRLRLEAEIIRDNALAASGLLVRTLGGPSVRPPQPAGLAEYTFGSLEEPWVESTGPDRYRRGLYTWFQRTRPYPMLLTFDAPDANGCCVRRERSNTPLQALTLLNDPVFVECAQALGQRLAAEPSDPAERLRCAFQLCIGREPTPDEQRVLTKLYANLFAAAQVRQPTASRLGPEQWAGGERAETAAWVAVARALLNLDEFVTRE